jgi:hypothetical protein
LLARYIVVTRRASGTDRQIVPRITIRRADTQRRSDIS